MLQATQPQMMPQGMQMTPEMQQMLQQQQMMQQPNVGTTPQVDETAIVKRETKKDNIKRFYGKERASFNDSFVRPLITDLENILKLTFACGTAHNFAKSGVVTKVGPKEFKRKDLTTIQKDFVKRVSSVSKHYEEAMRKGAKRRKNKTKDQPRHTIGRYDQTLVDFFKEASGLHPDLAIFKQLSFVKDGKLSRVLALNMLTQIFTIYFVVMERYSPSCGQLIVPDELMKRHFGTDLDDTISRQHESPNQEYRNDKINNPGLVRFPYVQVLANKYYKKPKDEPEDILAILKSDEAHKQLDQEISLLKEYKVKMSEKKMERLAEELLRNPDAGKKVPKRNTNTVKKSEGMVSKLDKYQQELREGENTPLLNTWIKKE